MNIEQQRHWAYIAFRATPTPTTTTPEQAAQQFKDKALLPYQFNRTAVSEHVRSRQYARAQAQETSSSARKTSTQKSQSEKTCPGPTMAPSDKYFLTLLVGVDILAALAYFDVIPLENWPSVLTGAWVASLMVPMCIPYFARQLDMRCYFYETARSLARTLRSKP